MRKRVDYKVNLSGLFVQTFNCVFLSDGWGNDKIAPIQSGNWITSST